MNLEKLKGLVPANIIEQCKIACKYGVDGPKRLSHLLGQCMAESQNFTHFVENLNYTTPEVIAKTFKRAFKATGVEDAKNYTHNPEKLANHVYANRNGNGNEESGDGYRYRGRGALQTTGKANYEQLTKETGIDFVANPDWLEKPEYCLLSALVFFKVNKLWELCDSGTDFASVKIITEHVNGGEEAFVQRLTNTQNIYAALTSK